MASVERHSTAVHPWTRGRQTVALVLLVGSLAFVTIAFKGQTMSTQLSQVREPATASLALPCRHQMTLSKERPACAGTAPADVVARDGAGRKPHRSGSRHQSCAKELNLHKGGAICIYP